MKKETLLEGIKFSVIRDGKESIICLRYYFQPINLTNLEDKVLEVKRIIENDLKQKEINLINKSKKVRYNDDNQFLLISVFKDIDIIAETTIDLDDFPTQIKYKICVKPLLKQINNLLTKLDEKQN